MRPSRIKGSYNAGSERIRCRAQSWRRRLSRSGRARPQRRPFLDRSLTTSRVAAPNVTAMDIRSESLLAGRKGLVVGIANAASIAYGCARMFRRCGAELAVTWLNEKARPYVEPLAQSSPRRSRCRSTSTQPGAHGGGVRRDPRAMGAARLRAALDRLRAARGSARPRRRQLAARASRRAMDISCHSFLRMARLAEPLMTRRRDAAHDELLGAAKVVPHYGVMGPVKAALEASVRYLATELGPQRHPRQCGVARADAHARRLRHRPASTSWSTMAVTRSPLPRQVEIDDVGASARSS